MICGTAVRGGPVVNVVRAAFWICLLNLSIKLRSYNYHHVNKVALFASACMKVTPVLKIVVCP